MCLQNLILFLYQGPSLLFLLYRFSVPTGCLTLCDPWTVACQAPLSMGFFFFFFLISQSLAIQDGGAILGIGLLFYCLITSNSSQKPYRKLLLDYSLHKIGPSISYLTLSWVNPRWLDPFSILRIFYVTHWSGVLFPSTGDLYHPGIKTASPGPPALAGQLFTTASPGKPTI